VNLRGFGVPVDGIVETVEASAQHETFVAPMVAGARGSVVVGRV
jgi:hypothetical protein